MDPLAWLGLRKQQAQPQLRAIHAAVTQLLPQDEPVVHRYVVAVAVLLTRVAHADGVFLQCELDHLHRLFRHVDGMPRERIGELCQTLNEAVPALNDDTVSMLYRELRSLCDAGERAQVMRLLAAQAVSDGDIATSEHACLQDIAAHLAIADEELAEIEASALRGDEPPLPPDSLIPSRPKGQVG